MYFILKFTLIYTLHVYFRKIKVLNRPKKYRDSVIFVSNHPSAFLDPLIIAERNKSIIHFMVRADIFKWWIKPITWSSQMMPIYRAIDGVDTKEKNKSVFENAYKVLKNRKGIIVFGEGFTDDVFIRSLKPLKKGPARMAFGAMEETDWKLDLKVCCVGLNYADPNRVQSDLVLSSSDYIQVKDYKERYLENPNKAVNHLMKEIEQKLKDQITYVEDKKRAPLHEKIMRLTKKGMNASDFDRSIPLESRYKYSKKLAKKLNAIEDEKFLDDIEQEVNTYFDEIQKHELRDTYVEKFQKQGKLSVAKEWITMILLFPLFIVGLIHNLIPYLFVKRFVEKSFKRKVFWGGVKMMLGKLFVGLYNIVFVILLHIYVFKHHWISWPYYFIVPASTFLIAYYYKVWWKHIKEKKTILKLNQENKLTSIIELRLKAEHAAQKLEL